MDEGRYISQEKLVSDSPGGRRDLIGVENDSNAFARAFCSSDIETPIVLGVFGPWGAGKTFFMDRLLSKCDDISGRDNLAERPVRLLQIKFNSWHYAESNLWASLVDVILTRLRTDEADKRSRLPSGGTGLQSIDEFINKLGVTIRVRKALEETHAKLREEHQQAVEHESDLRNRLSQNKNELSRYEDMYSKMGDFDLVAEPARLFEFSDTSSEQDVRKFRRLLGGIKARSYKDLASEVISAGPVKATRLGFALGRSLSPVLLVFGLLTGMFMVFAVLFGGYSPDRYSAFIPRSPDQALLYIMNGVVFALAPWLFFWSYGVKRYNWLRGHVRFYGDRIEEARHNLLSRIASIRAQTDEATAVLSSAEQNKRKYDKLLEDAEVALREAGSADQVSQYIRQRLDSNEIGKELGMLALVRRDFEELSKLLVAVDDSDAIVPNRIILYVDDLDRCVPERVVQVLEAVHLLLAFPLFVVVLAADPRWLFLSLRTHFSSLLQISGSGGTDGPGRGPATPRDYLEKIVQLPYWVPRMTAEHVTNLLRGWFPHKACSGNFIDAPISVAKIANSLVGNLSSDEQKAMIAAGSIIARSPREVLRFRNIYIVLRGSTASVSPGQEDPRPITLFLLAISIGAPGLSLHIFDHIERQAEPINIRPLLISLDSSPKIGSSPEWVWLFPALEAYIKCLGSEWNSDDIQPWIPRVRQFTFMDFVG